jgi:hypothetical protein
MRAADSQQLSVSISTVYFSYLDIVMADPQVGAGIDELERADRKTAELVRRTLDAGEAIDMWAIGLDDQLVALTPHRALIVKRGFRAGAPLGGRVASIAYTEIINAELRLGKATGIFEIRAAGMPEVDAWAYRGRRSRVHELPNGLTIANGQAAEFARVVQAIRERVAGTHRPPAWIPPPGLGGG